MSAVPSCFCQVLLDLREVNCILCHLLFHHKSSVIKKKPIIKTWFSTWKLSEILVLVKNDENIVRLHVFFFPDYFNCGFILWYWPYNFQFTPLTVLEVTTWKAIWRPMIPPGLVSSVKFASRHLQALMLWCPTWQHMNIRQTATKAWTWSVCTVHCHSPTSPTSDFI